MSAELSFVLHQEFNVHIYDKLISIIFQLAHFLSVYSMVMENSKSVCPPRVWKLLKASTGISPAK